MCWAEEMPNVPLFYYCYYYFGEKGLRDTEESNLCYVRAVRQAKCH